MRKKRRTKTPVTTNLLSIVLAQEAALNQAASFVSQTPRFVASPTFLSPYCTDISPLGLAFYRNFTQKQQAGVLAAQSLLLLFGMIATKKFFLVWLDQRLLRFALIIFCLSCGFGQGLMGQLQMSSFFSEGMVLQRSSQVPLWGYAEAGAEVKVDWRGQAYAAHAEANGRWQVELPTGSAGGPYTLSIRSGSDYKQIEEVWVGEVWLCSGQSNMELPMRRVAPRYPEEMAGTNNPGLRYFEVPKTYRFEGPDSLLQGGQWQKVDAQSIGEIAAVPYFFAAALYRHYQVPIGLINASLGGSPVEAWMSEEALRPFPKHHQELKEYQQAGKIDAIEAENRFNRDDWYRRVNREDPGLQNAAAWHTGQGDDWTSFEVPGYWSAPEGGLPNGSAWFRRSLVLPADFDASQPAELNLGRIVDADSVWVNGHFVGTTGYQYPPRWYEVPAGVLQAGQNTLVVRIINESGRGGFVADKSYYLLAGGDTLSLQGNWQWRRGAQLPPKKGEIFVRWKPGGLYNAMIAPLLPYRFKGVIWYQGESNVSAAEEYYELFPAMIKDWRSAWDEPDFPFLFVQLANLNAPCAEPCESGMARLRDAQASALALPNTAMAVAYDVGEWNDIHPLNKRDVSERLALGARKVAYKEDVLHSGPTLQKVARKKNRLVLTYSCVGEQLLAKDGRPGGFALAGADGVFVNARAEIRGKKVHVWAPGIEAPRYLRYAWADNPDKANLYNSEQLPALPFSIELIDKGFKRY